MRTGYRAPDRAHARRLPIGIGLVSLLVPAVSLVAAQETGEEATARVRVYMANLRADCGAEHEVVAGLPAGDEVAVLERLDGWSRVRHAASGVEGCVLASDLKPAAEPVPEVAAENTPVAPARTGLIWRVERGEASGYLLGSIHMARQDLYPLPDPVEAAYEEATVVAFEADPVELESPELQERVASRSLLPEGTRLQDILPAPTYEELVHRAEEIGMPAYVFDRLEPWAAAMMLTVSELRMGGLHPDWGIDNHLFQRAWRDRKQTAYLEDAAFSLSLITDLTTEQAVSFLQHGLEQSETMLEMVDELLTAWPVGEIDPFEELVLVSFEDHPDIHERFLTARNRAWIEPIEALLASNSPTLVVVGAGHLVGKESVVELLRQRGYCVERVTPESVAEPALTAAVLCN